MSASTKTIPELIEAITPAITKELGPDVNIKTHLGESGVKINRRVREIVGHELDCPEEELGAMTALEYLYRIVVAIRSAGADGQQSE